MKVVSNCSCEWSSLRQNMKEEEIIISCDVLSSTVFFSLFPFEKFVYEKQGWGWKREPAKYQNYMAEKEEDGRKKTQHEIKGRSMKISAGRKKKNDDGKEWLPFPPLLSSSAFIFFFFISCWWWWWWQLILLMWIHPYLPLPSSPFPSVIRTERRRFIIVCINYASFERERRPREDLWSSVQWIEDRIRNQQRRTTGLKTRQMMMIAIHCITCFPCYSSCCCCPFVQICMSLYILFRFSFSIWFNGCLVCLNSLYICHSVFCRQSQSQVVFLFYSWHSCHTMIHS